MEQIQKGCSPLSPLHPLWGSPKVAPPWLYFLKKCLSKWGPNDLKWFVRPKKHGVKMKKFFQKFFWMMRKLVFLAFFQKSTYFKRLQNDLKCLFLCFLCILAYQGVKGDKVFTFISHIAPVRHPQISLQAPKWLIFKILFEK